MSARRRTLGTWRAFTLGTTSCRCVQPKKPLLVGNRRGFWQEHKRRRQRRRWTSSGRRQVGEVGEDGGKGRAGSAVDCRSDRGLVIILRPSTGQEARTFFGHLDAPFCLFALFSRAKSPHQHTHITRARCLVYFYCVSASDLLGLFKLP
ncbi:uncharacterized protein FOMMEDRAFT_152294 [Fomitiporia mediterranea MF3/22]|uniref:uncharacterized protein n=1 Tax=Fomitiporia mediterranea (strain MF3/22) TaxID=694068 RepID=UPI0004408D93|nr:uncharacterized protein FOMMEDRAFT_152294 [Fomitiporia mediterranea MF3/22]EJD06955.1 hypothetical protein FOMMEDRAFT_152294 [Fomitiporia mediterranea MF3/22]